MAKGKKTGGRQKGSRNKTTEVIAQAMAAVTASAAVPDALPAKSLGVFFDLGGENGHLYAKQLHAIACEPHPDVQARLKALSLIAPYVWGKPVEKHEISGKDGGPVRVVHEHHPA